LSRELESSVSGTERTALLCLARMRRAAWIAMFVMAGGFRRHGRFRAEELRDDVTGDKGRIEEHGDQRGDPCHRTPPAHTHAPKHCHLGTALGIPSGDVTT
jgi:hypothetical protein